MVSAKDTAVYRRDVQARGRALSATEREKLIKPYLPTPPRSLPVRHTRSQNNGLKAKRKPRRQKLIRTFVKSKLHILIYYFIHLVFGIYIRLRQIYHSVADRILAIIYYHHRTPALIRKDVRNLSRLPGHLSVILTLKVEEEDGLETLMDEVAELGAWCASAGIPTLSIYEKSGILKSYITNLHSQVTQKLAGYFGPPPSTPRLRIFAPNHSSHSPSPVPSPPSGSLTHHPVSGTTNGTNHHVGVDSSEVPERRILTLLLLSATDGRDTLVDLTRTLAEMSQSHKLHPRDITSELINAEISATTSVPAAPHSPGSLTANRLSPDAKSGVNAGRSSSSEPDLLIVFSPYVKLDGYPPWQIRLTEIFCVGDSSSDVSGRILGTRVEYQAFLRGLWKYARADMRFGR